MLSESGAGDGSYDVEGPSPDLREGLDDFLAERIEVPGACAFGNLYDLLLSVRDGTALQKDACAESIRGLRRYTTSARLGSPRAAVR